MSGTSTYGIRNDDKTYVYSGKAGKYHIIGWVGDARRRKKKIKPERCRKKQSPPFLPPPPHHSSPTMYCLIPKNNLWHKHARGFLRVKSICRSSSKELYQIAKPLNPLPLYPFTPLTPLTLPPPPPISPTPFSLPLLCSSSGEYTATIPSGKTRAKRPLVTVSELS